MVSFAAVLFFCFVFFLFHFSFWSFREEGNGAEKTKKKNEKRRTQRKRTEWLRRSWRLGVAQIWKKLSSKTRPIKQVAARKTNGAKKSRATPHQKSNGTYMHPLCHLYSIHVQWRLIVEGEGDFVTHSLTHSTGTPHKNLYTCAVGSGLIRK